MHHTADRTTPTHLTTRWRRLVAPAAAAIVLLLGFPAAALTSTAQSPGAQSGASDVRSGGASAERSRAARTWPPTPDSVGVPRGTSLSQYRGSCTITRKGTVIDRKVINCAPLDIETTGVVIKRSKINGSVRVGAQDDSDSSGTGPTRVTVVSSEIDASSSPDFRPIEWSHYVVKKSYLHGSYSGGECHNACTIKWSYVEGNGDHASGLRMLRNGTLKHSTVWCKPLEGLEDGGCSGNITMYQEFGTPHHNLLKHNYFPAGKFWYSLKFNGDDAGHVRVLDNRFGRARAGLTEDWDRKPTNVWKGNTYTNGRTARP
jgi:hypothetical protein